MNIRDIKSQIRNLPRNLTLLVLVVGFWPCISTFASNDETRKFQNQNPHNDKLTADDQVRGTKEDTELTRRIREKLVDDDNLSVSAKNIKIITLRGMVTLRGNVKTTEERTRISEHVRQVSSNLQLKDELTVHN